MLHSDFFEALRSKVGELPSGLKSELEKRGYLDAYENALSVDEQREVIDLAVSYLKHRGIRRSRPPKVARYSAQDYSPAARAFCALQWSSIERILQTPEESLLPSEKILRRAILTFRETYLEGLIPLEAIPEWLKQHQPHAAQQCHLEVRLTPEQRTELVHWLLSGQSATFTFTFERRQLAGLRESIPLLAYGGQVYAVPPELRDAVDILHTHTGWSVAQCIEYLLAGSMPTHIPLDASVEASPDAPTRITLRVPIAMRPETVGQVYASFRKVRRLRSISRKQAELVRYVEVFRLQFPRAKWSEIATAWNRHCEEQGFPKSWHITPSGLRCTYNRTVRSLQHLMTVYDPPQGSRWTFLAEQGIY